MIRTTLDTRWAWLAALGCFILAGLTGALFRFGMLYGLPEGLQLGNVRHAHSHLMYFSWVTPALMALIVAWLPRQTGRPVGRGYGPTIVAALLFGLLAYPAFLLYGYTLAQVGAKRLPLSMMASALNALPWYAFMILYWRDTRRTARTLPLLSWDAALAAIVLASLGGIGLMALVFLRVTNPFWSEAMVHLFLDLFADGWFIFGVLGLAYAAHPQAERPFSRWATWLIFIGLPATALLGVQSSLVPETLRPLASLGALLVGAGLLAHVVALWPAVIAAWRIPLAFLGLKAAGELAASLPVIAVWAEGTGLRIPYLHWLLLGFVSIGLVMAAGQMWGWRFVRGWRWYVAGVLLLQVSLIPLTGLWPAAWVGRWTLVFAAWATLAPIAGAVILVYSAWSTPGVGLRRLVRQPEGI